MDEEAETVILQGAEVVASDSDEFLPVNSASFTITDDDTRGITISPASLATGSGIGMKEGGDGNVSLVLDTEPTDTVTVTVGQRARQSNQAHARNPHLHPVQLEHHPDHIRRVSG